MRTTYMAKPADISRKWYVIDAEGKALGRLASLAASILRGKHKPEFTPHIDTGDHVIIINAAKVLLTGKKRGTKEYRYYTGYPGGLRRIPYTRLLAERPEKAIEVAVRGMLPHNRLGRAMARKLKVYRGPEHPHAAQQPVKWDR